MKKLLVFIFSLLTSATFFSNAGVLNDCLMTDPPVYYPPFVTQGGGEQTPPSTQSHSEGSIYFKDLYSAQVFSGYASITNGLFTIYLNRGLNISSVTATNRSRGLSSSMFFQEDDHITIVLTSSHVDGWWDIRITTMEGRIYEAEFYSQGGTGILHDPGFQEMQP